jgi:energy-coupling factor transporter ATP-binding protein EcfA2
MAAAEADGSGSLVVSADRIGKAFGDQPPVVRDFSARIMRGDRVGIVGPNGAGKTTLLKMLTGTLPPDEGEVRLGTNLQMVTLDQMRAGLDPATTLADALTEVRGKGTRRLAIFSDPDCPYCRRLEAELRGLDDVTIHTFLMPLASLHPAARGKAGRGVGAALALSR